MDIVFETAFSQLNYPPGSIGRDTSMRYFAEQAMCTETPRATPATPRSMNVAPPPSSVTAHLLQNLLVDRYLTEYGHFMDPTLKSRCQGLVVADLQRQAPYSKPTWMKSWWGSVIRDVYQEAPVMMATLRVTASNPAMVPEGFIRGNMPSTMHFVHAAATCGEYDWIKVFANIEDHVHYGTDQYAGIRSLVNHGCLDEAKARIDNDESMLEARLFGQWELMVQPMQEAIRKFKQEHKLL